MSYLRLLHFVRNDREWLYIPLHKFYNKKRNLLKTVALRVRAPSSPPKFAPHYLATNFGEVSPYKNINHIGGPASLYPLPVSIIIIFVYVYFCQMIR